MTIPETYIRRCIELARRAAGYTAPNPMVGAVLVHNGRIIGEGYHKNYGGPHAEVNCIADVRPEDRHLINGSTLYVSLEPCAHYGKTPPCTELIISNGIPVVVIGCQDPFGEVNGNGIARLKEAGVEVHCGVLEQECTELNRRFFTYHQQHRPYVVLKWAQTADGKIGTGTATRLMISNEITNRLVHRWRSEEAAILVGTNTALLDNPGLNLRTWPGKDPVRMVVDMELRLPSNLKIFSKHQRTVIFNSIRHAEEDNILYYQVASDANLVDQVLNACIQLKIQSILVEGGAKLLQTFIDDGSWDEARVITNTTLIAGSGVPAPVLTKATPVATDYILNDQITYFRRNEFQP